MLEGLRSTLIIWVIPLIGMMIFVGVFSPAHFTLTALRVELSINLFDSGNTQVNIPPVGSVWAHTHTSPLLLRITLMGVDLEVLKDLIDTSSRSELIPILREELTRIVFRYVLWLLLLGSLGGGLAALVVGRNHPREILHAAGVGLVAIALLLSVTYSTYNVDAFRQPRFEGIIKAAPWAVGLLDQSLVKARELSDQMGTLATNLYTLFERIDQLEPLGSVEAERKILLVSDIHNNPVAFNLVRDVANTFAPDFIIDAGDLTDYGTSFEANFLTRLTELEVPYVITPGNHDSPQVVEQLRTLPNVVLIESDTVVVRGVRIAGEADPSSRRQAPALPTEAEIDAAVRRLNRQVNVVPLPDIVVAHSPLIAGRAEPVPPVTVSGHTHRVGLRDREGTVWIDPGTTGAAGIRGLQAEQEVPYSLALLYLDRVPGKQAGGGPQYSGERTGSFRPKAVDILTVRSIGAGLTLERQVFIEPISASNATPR